MRLDLSTLLGVFAALGGIGLGLALEGGSLTEILQPTAALIVFGGTAGATLVAQPMSVSLRALKSGLRLAFEPKHETQADIELIAELAAEARRGGALAIEKRISDLENPFLKDALQAGVDGVDAPEIRELMEARIENDMRRRHAEASVFECAGGFAPTVGILGAVLGLIQVMKHLEDIDEVGKGIAVAFVATIYGVAIANLFFLPAAKKIMARAEKEAVHHQLLLEGAIRILSRANPRLIRARLECFVDDAPAAPADPSPAKSPVAPESA